MNGSGVPGLAGGTVAETLSAWGRGLRLEDVPEQARRAACRHLLDAVGTAVAAARLGAAAPALSVADSLGGPPQAAPLGSVRELSAAAAALADGALVHGLDFDDTHAAGLVHATAVVLPAAFTVGQQVGADGAQVLRAALVGYEVVCRVAMAVPHGFHARGIHATHACGTLSSAMVAGLLLGLPEDGLVAALGVAGSASGGLLEFLHTGSSTKALHPGTASMSGVLAAMLAAAGASGPASVVEGRYGVLGALTGTVPDPAAVTAALGESWEVTRVTVKPYPACQLLHATLDALRALPEPVAADSVAEVVADVHPDSVDIVCEPQSEKAAPRTPYDAKFSLPWSAAALLVDGAVGVETYDEASIARPQVRALAARVRTRVVDCPGHAADAPGRVVVRLTDGRQVEGRVPCSAGGPDRPLDDAGLLAKFTENCGGSPLAAELADRLLQLAGEPDLRRIHALAAQIVGTVSR